MMPTASDHNICTAFAAPPAVTPLRVFAAGQRSFTAIVRGQDWLHGVQGARLHARAALFSALPLEKYGWDRAAAKLSLVRRTGADEALWKLSRSDT